MRFAPLLIVIAACGSHSHANDNHDVDAPGEAPGAADDATDGTSVTQRYLPWKVGAVWSYKLTDPAGVQPAQMNKLTTVMSEGDVGGVHAGTTAFLVHAEQMNGSKDVYEAPSGDLDVRYKSTFYDANGTMTAVDVDQPYRLKLDESAAHTITGAQWSTSFTETSNGGAPATKNESWRVVNASESLTVIAGTYTCLHVQRTSNGGTVQDYWYARGVGKVKETGGGQNEELMSFTPGL